MYRKFVSPERFKNRCLNSCNSLFRTTISETKSSSAERFAWATAKKAFASRLSIGNLFSVTPETTEEFFEKEIKAKA